MTIILVTASDAALKPCRDICEQTLRRYCWVPGRTAFYFVRDIPDDYPAHPSWYKVGLIKRFLPAADYVLWLDADAMIVGDTDLARIIQPVTLNIARDNNGINCGVMAWKNCDQSFKVLEQLECLRPKFARHYWAEQAALMTFVDEIEVHYQPKHIWNAYPYRYTREVGGDETEATIIAHYPALSVAERVMLMQAMLG